MGTGAEPKARRHHGNRHGRSEHARQAVLEAADDLLVEKGFAGVTIEGIAASAGVAKQTIYRWYDSKADLMLDAFLARYAEIMPPAMLSGDPLANLRDYLHHLVEVLAFGARPIEQTGAFGSDREFLGPGFGKECRVEIACRLFD